MHDLIDEQLEEWDIRRIFYVCYSFSVTVKVEIVMSAIIARLIFGIRIGGWFGDFVVTVTLVGFYGGLF